HGMTSWNRTLVPQVLDAVSAAGYLPEGEEQRRLSSPARRRMTASSRSRKAGDSAIAAPTRPPTPSTWTQT
ncbi:hypothetical protein, partial [Modestobacter marinus]|uniref:hypothetical protein n=1 Tax=Modestobacter marinus TaxID=477641 RepID=UPI001C980500